MGWILPAIGATIIIKTIRDAKRESEENKRRKNTPCRFKDGISKQEFETLVLSIPRRKMRIEEVKVEGPFVYGTVRSQSGISTWNFTLDFNDYGHITGRYWITSENTDSPIAQAFCDRICKKLEAYGIKS